MYNEVRKVHISVKGLDISYYQQTSQGPRQNKIAVRKLPLEIQRKEFIKRWKKISFVGYLINDAIIPDNRESRLFRICFVNTLISPWYKGVVLNFHDSTLEISRD